MGFLPVETVLEPRKELAQVSGRIATDLPFVKAGTTFKGYEIHAGQTTPTQTIKAPITINKRLFKSTNESAGAISDNGLVFGCYIHGLFDNVSLRKQLFAWLCECKGVESFDRILERDISIDQLDRIADLLEEHVDIKNIEDMMR